METIIFCQWSRSHQSIAFKGLCICGFRVMSWEGKSEPNIKCCLGRKVELVHIFTTIQNFLDTLDGEPMELEWNIVPGFTTLQLINKSPRGPKWATHHNSRDELSSCRCSMTSYGDLKTMNGNALLTPHLWLQFAKEVFQQGHWSFLGPGSETKWYSTYNERRQG